MYKSLIVLCVVYCVVIGKYRYFLLKKKLIRIVKVIDIKLSYQFRLIELFSLHNNETYFILIGYKIVAI